MPNPFRKSGLALLSLLCFISCKSRTPHQAVMPINFAQQSSGFYTGWLIRDPEAFSGLREQPDGRGGAVGIDIELNTDLPGDASASASDPETLQFIEVGVYERTSAPIQLGEENFFVDSKQSEGMRYENGRLTLHAHTMDLNLLLLPNDRWSGRLHRSNFNGEVVLTRPGAGLKRAPWWAGAWLSRDRALPECLHLAPTAEGASVAWLDRHQNGHFLHFATPTPRRTFQIYGVRLDAQVMENGLLLSSPPSDASTPFSFLASPTSNRNVLHINRIQGAAGSLSETWTRMHGTSCSSTGPAREKHQRSSSASVLNLF